MPDHLEQDMAIILLMICYLCYVQFCLQVYDEAKGMLIIVLLVESENMDSAVTQMHNVNCYCEHCFYGQLCSSRSDFTFSQLCCCLLLHTLFLFPGCQLAPAQCRCTMQLLPIFAFPFIGPFASHQLMISCSSTSTCSNSCFASYYRKPNQWVHS